MDTTLDSPPQCLSPVQIEAALAAANSFLARWEDAFTASNRDELSQDAVVLAWLRWPTLRDKSRFHAFVRTIARRRRAAALDKHSKLPRVSFDAHPGLTEEVVAPTPDTQELQVAGEWVAQDELLGALPRALSVLTRLNATLLMSYYEGFTCGELAERHGLSAENVKVRIHRARRRVGDFLRRDQRRAPEAREAALPAHYSSRAMRVRHAHATLWKETG